MLNHLWGMIWWLAEHLPWLFMGAAAGLAWSKQRRSLPILLELIGGLGVFVLAVLSWLVFSLLGWTHASFQVYSPVRYVFNFLEVVALLIFAVGFCWEKVQQWRASPAAVVVTRVR